MAFSIKVVNPKLLKNVLHHVDTHNRLMEEREMWNSRKNQRDESEESDYDTRTIPSGRRLSYGKMRSDNLHTETTREIVKLKEKAGKWNHSGFMELYPDEFLNKNSMDEMSSSDDDGRKDRKKRKLKRKKRKSSEELETKRRKRPKTSVTNLETTVNSEPMKKHRHVNSHRHADKRGVKRNSDSKKLRDVKRNSDSKKLRDVKRNSDSKKLRDVKRNSDSEKLLKKRKKKQKDKMRDESRRKVKSKHKRRRQERTLD